MYGMADGRLYQRGCRHLEHWSGSGHSRRVYFHNYDFGEAIMTKGDGLTIEDNGGPIDTIYIRERFDKLMKDAPREFVQAECDGRELSAARIEIMFSLLEDYKMLLDGHDDFPGKEYGDE